MPNIELDPHEWRLKGAKRIPAFKKQPATPAGKASYSRFNWLVIVCGIWAACVIIWAHSNPGQDPWVIGLISLGPAGILFGLLVFNDD